MKAIHSTAFLCGCFSLREKLTPITSIDPKWEKVLKTKDEKSMMEKFYYPEFVDFCYQDQTSKSAKGMERYIFPVDTNIEISLPKGKRHTLFIKDIRLFILPYNLLIYAIHITQDGADLDDITASLSVLRNVSDYKKELINDSWGVILQPIVDIYKQTSSTYTATDKEETFRYFDLMENGNKLKLFQIVEIESKGIEEKEQNELLFELGTLAPIGSYNNNSFSSPSQEYFNRIMGQNRISVFNNWKALSLFDTFTILSYPTNSYLLENWTNSYFGMIYIHSLFLKFYLFRMNILFRKKASKISYLEKEFLAFERNCCFHKISYNFLPLEFYESLDIGLEINEERKQLYHMIEQEKNIQDKEGDRKMNNLLFFLTCLTIFSTVWDFSCLFNQIYPYQEGLGSDVLGYRLVTSILLLFVIIIILGYRLTGNIRKKRD